MVRRRFLEAGAMRLEFAPGLGGAVTALTRDGAPLLRPTPLDARDALQTACFPLIPYANRIAHGRVVFAGRSATLPPNLAGHPHPLHGEGWRTAWQVEDQARDRVVLSYSSEAGPWPWKYSACQTIHLDPRGVTLELALTNTDTQAAPVGLGFHPYFPDPGDARLTARLGGLWLTDAQGLPTGHVDGWFLADWRRGARVAGERLIDHCHSGWDGAALIDVGTAEMRMTASPELAWLHIYAPPAAGFFCVEPVSQRPDALNAADPIDQGIRLVAPGETFSVWMTLQVA